MRTRPRILVATDFSSGAERALDLAVELARRLHAGVQLVHAYALPTVHFLDAAIIPSAERVTTLLDDAGSRLEEQARRVRELGLSVETMLREGEPAQVVSAIAREGDVDLIVVGARGEGALAHLVLGSVADRIARTASKPVVIAR